ncbi:MAG TPA: amidase family protein [Pyrinomonadaceae bacterium]|jgi:fatty acid amide hydrolase
MENLHRKSAVELLNLIASKQLSSREATEHFIDRIEQVNPSLNAVVLKFYDEARKKAAGADAALARGETLGRLHGLPFTIKECFDYVGSPSTLGVLARKNDKPAANDAYIEALMSEGGIVLGKTNVPQLLIFIESANRVYGRTNNPVNPAFTCGGSSGGEGAIVGAGASPVGIGSDIGGSVRFPAAFCGICSIKPTMWRTPDLTRYGATVLEGPIGSVAGVLGNFAADLDLFLRIIDERAAQTRKVEPLGDYRKVDVSRLKIGYYLSDGIFEPMAAVKRGVLEAVEKLKSRGAEVTEFSPPNPALAEEIFLRILTTDDAALFTQVLEGEKPMPQLRNMFMLAQASPFKRRALQRAARLFGQKSVTRLIPYFGGRGAENLREWAKRQAQYRAEFLAAMDAANLDAILSPVCALPAFLHDSVDKVGLGGTYTLLYNVLGFPAGVARISKVRKEEAVARKSSFDLLEFTAAKTERRAEGLPLSVQIAARPWREDVVLALIEELHSRAF